MRLNQACLKLAFTIAEILITLAIIGIVAAITIPSVINNIQDREFKAMWKKQYSMLSQIYSEMMREDGGTLAQGFTNGTEMDNMIRKMGTYYGITPCKAYSYMACNSTSTDGIRYKTLSGSDVHQENVCKIQYLLKDGAQFYSFWNHPYDGQPVDHPHILIDVNGFAKKPNVLGRDLFGVILFPDKIVPIGAPGTGLENTCNKTSVSCPADYGWYNGGNCSGAGCSAEALYN